MVLFDSKEADKMRQLSEEEFQRVLEIKRDLHMHPELSGRELRTT